MFPALSSRYHPRLLEERDQIALSGGFRDRARYDLVDRPPYAVGLLAAADVAAFSGLRELTAIEFGVAEGEGMLTLCALAQEVTKETGIQFTILGFDTGEGLPSLLDHRDHPEIWSSGDFAVVDKRQLEDKLPDNARMIWGDINDTLEKETRALTARAPIGFVSFDVDLFSSTLGALRAFDTAADKLLPVTIAYMDDTHGSPGRIGSLFRNRWCGQFAAIEEFNAAHQTRKIDRLYTLKYRRPFDRELWLEQMFGVHVFDHPLRQTLGERTPLTMDEHQSHRMMDWPL